MKLGFRTLWWCLWITGGVLWFVIGFQHLAAEDATIVLSSDTCSSDTQNIYHAARPEKTPVLIAEKEPDDLRQNTGEENRVSAPGSNVKHPIKKKSALDSCVNLNSATSQELTALEGIGTVIAERIIKHRQENGPFKDLRELMNVKGIGQKKFDKIQAHICLLP